MKIETGYLYHIKDEFMDKTYDLLIKYLDKDKISIKEYELNHNDIKIVYEDIHQIVVDYS